MKNALNGDSEEKIEVAVKTRKCKYFDTQRCSKPCFSVFLHDSTNVLASNVQMRTDKPNQARNMSWVQKLKQLQVNFAG